MRNTWLIARREYIERVHTKAFLISTILIPLLLYCFTVLPAKMITRKATGVRNIVVVASSQQFGERIRERIAEEANDSGRQYKVTVDANPADAERDALRGQVTSGEIALHDHDHVRRSGNALCARRKVVADHRGDARLGYAQGIDGWQSTWRGRGWVIAIDDLGCRRRRAWRTGRGCSCRHGPEHSH